MSSPGPGALRRRRALCIGLLAGGLALAGCSIPTDATANSLPAAQDPLVVGNSVPKTTTPLGHGPAVTYKVFFVFNNALFPALRTASKPISAFEAIDESLNLLAAGPSLIEARQGTSTFLLERQAPAAESYAHGIVVIQLDNGFSLLFGTALAYAMGQIVYTVTDIPHVPVRGVIFMLGTKVFDGYSPSGRIIRGPVTRADFAQIAGSTS